MSIDETLHQPLHVPFGRGYDIPPPKARVALRVRRFTEAVVNAQNSGAAVDIGAVLQRLGLPEDYGIESDLLGVELYEEMLDDLTAEEFARVVRAVGVWVLPGATRELAEQSLTDPMVAPAQAARAVRRATARRRPAASPGSASKSTGTT